EPVRLAWMDPGDVRPWAVHASAVGPQLRHRSRNVLALESDEIDALAVLGQEAADRLVGIGRLEQLDVADARGQDRVLESERLGLVAPVPAEAEELREPLDRLVQIAHDHRQLHHVTQHGLLLAFQNLATSRPAPCYHRLDRAPVRPWPSRRLL